MTCGNGSAVGEARFWQGSGPHWRRLLGIVLALALGLLPLPGDAVGALSLPWQRNPRGASPALGLPAASALQEVAPPAGVQQLRRALEERRPRLAIVAPADDALLPAGDWTLRLDVEDWPLVDAGELGLGTHLMVQIDDGPARPLLTRETVMPELSPGSHRLSVYAAWPWGEAVKAPGAWRQIRLHRVARNPLAVPAAGSPQLLAVAPAGPAAGEPVPLDVLLIDAPLQNLREDDARWRLRITVNGDSFLVDRQQTLWLEGWREGANALQLELVDPRGEPLNPPFNSLVREVRLERSAPPPPWRRGRLSDSELARLLGEAPSPEPGAEAGPEEAGPEPDSRPDEAADSGAADSGAEPPAEAAADADDPAAPAEPSPRTSPRIAADEGPGGDTPLPRPAPEPAPAPAPQPEPEPESEQEPEAADAGAPASPPATTPPPGPGPTPTPVESEPESEPEPRQDSSRTAPDDAGLDDGTATDASADARAATTAADAAAPATGSAGEPAALMPSPPSPPPPPSAPEAPEAGLLSRLRARLGR